MDAVLNVTPYPEYAADIVSAEGCYVTDSRGRRYADFESGVWCAGLGHSHPAVAGAISEQLGKIGHSGYHYTGEVVRRAAEMLLDVLNMPGGQCVFLSSGSEAVEFAVQAAGRMTKKNRFLCLEDYYLSAYGQSGAQAEGQWIQVDLTTEHWRGIVANLPYDEVGGFVFEPGSASGQVRLPPPEAVREIVRRTREAGGLIVVDEVTTGMGRTGRWFGHQYYGIRPDLVACGKGLGNGYPVSAVALANGLGNRLLATRTRYAQSHQNDPLGCAAVCAVIGQVKAEGLVSRAADTGAYFLAELEDLARRRPEIEDVRGRGLMLAVQLRNKVPVADIHRGLFDRGYIAGVNPARRTLRMYPPLIVDRGMVDGFVAALDDVLGK